MIETRREKVIFYIAVPLAAAIVGAVVTAISSHLLGTSSIDENIRIVLADKTLSALQKTELIKLINAGDDSFWSVVQYSTGVLAVALVWIAGAYADRLRNGK